MPGEPGEMEAMNGAFLGWVSQGLQHEVIVMASCCKKGGGQKGNNCHRQVYTQQCLWYCITVLRRDWVVVLCVSISVVALVSAATEPTSIWKTTTERALTGGTALTNRQRLTGHFNALTCCILVSSEVSHRTATMVNCNFVPKRWLAHSGYPLGGYRTSRNTAGPLTTHVPYAVNQQHRCYLKGNNCNQ